MLSLIPTIIFLYWPCHKSHQAGKPQRKYWVSHKNKDIIWHDQTVTFISQYAGKLQRKYWVSHKNKDIIWHDQTVTFTSQYAGNHKENIEFHTKTRI